MSILNIMGLIPLVLMATYLTKRDIAMIMLLNFFFSVVFLAYEVFK